MRQKSARQTVRAQHRNRYIFIRSPPPNERTEPSPLFDVPLPVVNKHASIEQMRDPKPTVIVPSVRYVFYHETVSEVIGRLSFCIKLYLFE